MILFLLVFLQHTNIKVSSQYQKAMNSVITATYIQTGAKEYEESLKINAKNRLKHIVNIDRMTYIYAGNAAVFALTKQTSIKLGKHILLQIKRDYGKITYTQEF